MSEAEPAPKCLTPGCSRPATVRGVCHGCRAVLYRAIRDGEMTMEQAEDLGLISRQRRKLPSNTSPLRRHLKNISPHTSDTRTPQ